MKEPRYIYGNKGCLFAVTLTGKFKILYTPFQILCIEDSFEYYAGRSCKIHAGNTVDVTEVYWHEINKIGYEIQGVIHPYHRFKLTLDF